MSSKDSTKKKAINQYNSSGSRSSRDLSFKPRFRHNYGYHGEFYSFILRYKELWQDKLFFVDESLIEKEAENDTSRIRRFPVIRSNDVKLPYPKLEYINKQQLEEALQLSRSSLELLLSRGNKEQLNKLNFGEGIVLNDSIDRNGIILNAGGHVTSMKWLTTPANSTSYRCQFLAVSVMINSENQANSVDNPQLSLFHKGPHSYTDSSTIRSGIQIWKYYLSENSLVLDKFYLTGSIGATADLDWVPIHTDDDNLLGILSGTFTDGKLHLLKIPRSNNNEPELANIIESSFSYRVLDTGSKNSSDIIGITSYDFLGYDKIIVGLTNGSIAEFILPFYIEDNEESDASVPSFVHRIGDSTVSSIMVAEPEPSRYVVVVNTSGIQCLAFEYQHFQQGYIDAYSTNSYLKPSYNHSLKMYVGSYSTDSISFNFIRSPQETPNSLLRVDGIISATQSSTILGHPLNITGNTYGEIHIVNYARKFLNGAKTTNKTLIPLKLWKLCLEDKILKLSGDFEPVSSEKTSQIAVTPPDVVISSLAWNENIQGSSIYTAGTISGLLILERLDPKHNLGIHT